MRRRGTVELAVVGTEDRLEDVDVGQVCAAVVRVVEQEGVARVIAAAA